MFDLIIIKKDGSPYWVEHFNDLDSANEWIKVEQTRPYWDKSYTFKIIDNTPPPMPDEEKKKRDAEQEEKKNQLSIYVSRIQELDKLDDLDPKELKENIRILVKFLKLKGLLD